MCSEQGWQPLATDGSVLEQRLELLGGAGALSSQLCGLQGQCRLFRPHCQALMSGSVMVKHQPSPVSLGKRNSKCLPERVSALYCSLVFSCSSLCHDDLTLKITPLTYKGPDTSTDVCSCSRSTRVHHSLCRAECQ